MSAILNPDQIDQADDLQVRIVEVPEWKGSIGVKVMAGTDRDKYEASLMKQQGKKFNADLNNARSKLLVMCLCDEKGARLYKDTETGRLGKKSSVVLDRLYEVAQEINGITEENIKDIEGNSGSDQSGYSGSD
jgi:hypothetical protein